MFDPILKLAAFVILAAKYVGIVMLAFAAYAFISSIREGNPEKRSTSIQSALIALALISLKAIVGLLLPADITIPDITL